MKTKYDGSKTKENLEKAFVGESQARNKYDFFASKAKKDGYEQIAAIFAETALNEKEHAKMWFKHLGGIGTTAENLLAAAAGEHEEWSLDYPHFAEVADKEGFPEIAMMYRAISVAEFTKRRPPKINPARPPVIIRIEIAIECCLIGSSSSSAESERNDDQRYHTNMPSRIAPSIRLN